MHNRNDGLIKEHTITALHLKGSLDKLILASLWAYLILEKSISSLIGAYQLELIDYLSQ
jgi:uncharacterized membrane protein YcgQ (UPF0703/DUF1980 family)